MSHKLSGKLYTQLKSALDKVAEKESFSLAFLSASLAVIRGFLQKLRHSIVQHPFENQQEEIRFFKTIKTRFYSEQIYYTALYNLYFHMPSGPLDTQISYYKDELEQLRRFFRLHAFYYQYYRSGFCELDHLYFVRGVAIGSGYIPDQPDPDPDFSTGLDYLFAKFIAFERLEIYIAQKLDANQGSSERTGTEGKPKCKWTGSKVGVVELAYGLYYSGEINRGDVEVQDIIVVLEEAFGISIGDGHRKFVDIRNRKNLSPTQLLDKMSAAIMQRVNEDREYRANRGIRLRKPI